MNIPRRIRASWIPAGGDITMSIDIGEQDLYVFVRLTPGEAAELADQLTGAVDQAEGHHEGGEPR